MKQLIIYSSYIITFVLVFFYNFTFLKFKEFKRRFSIEPTFVAIGFIYGAFIMSMIVLLTYNIYK